MVSILMKPSVGTLFFLFSSNHLVHLHTAFSSYSLCVRNTCVWAHLHMCAYAHGGQKATSSVIPPHVPSTLFFEQSPG